MTHTKFAEVVELLKDSGWGLHLEPDEAVKNLLKDGSKLSGVATIALLQKIDDILVAISDVPVKQKWERTRIRVREEIKSEIAELEEKHGPAPDGLYWFWLGVVHREIGSNILAGYIGRCYGCSCYFTPPTKGTELRKEYDKWKRRRPKRKSK